MPESVLGAAPAGCMIMDKSTSRPGLEGAHEVAPEVCGFRVAELSSLEPTCQAGTLAMAKDRSTMLPRHTRWAGSALVQPISDFDILQQGQFGASDNTTAATNFLLDHAGIRMETNKSARRNCSASWLAILSCVGAILVGSLVIADGQQVTGGVAFFFEEGACTTVDELETTLQVVGTCDNCFAQDILLEKSVFEQIADPAFGMVNIGYRQVECAPPGDIGVTVVEYRQDLGGYLKLVLKQVAGMGVSGVQLQTSSGETWLTSADGQTLVLESVLPEALATAGYYQSTEQFPVSVTKPSVKPEKEVEPVVDEVTPVVEEVKPVAKEVTPIEEEVTPVEEEVTPAKKKVTPVEEEVTPAVTSSVEPADEVQFGLAD
eukprot:gene17468-23772_t